MKVTISGSVWAQVAGLSLLPVLLAAGTPDRAANLSACKNGWPSCDRSRLTLSGVTEVAVAKHARNILNCRNGLTSCDRSKRTVPEAIGSEAREAAVSERRAYTLAAAERARNCGVPE